MIMSSESVQDYVTTYFDLLADTKNALQETTAGHASLQVVDLAARLIHIERANHWNALVKIIS